MSGWRRPPPDPTEPIDAYRRLVANPLLAVAVFVLSLLFLQASLRWENVFVFLGSLGLMVGSLFLVQFHCLDCGATDWLLNRNRHRCPPVVARWRSGRMDRWRPPTMTTQLSIWLHLLAALGALGLILFVLSAFAWKPSSADALGRSDLYKPPGNRNDGSFPSGGSPRAR